MEDGTAEQASHNLSISSERIQPPVLYTGASTPWQQKVLDAEAKLQGDLQQELAG